jgi:hypothetical protein
MTGNREGNMALVTRAAAVAIALSLVPVGLAAPARADDLDGTYTLFTDQSQRRTNGMPNPYQNSSATWISNGR